MPPESWDKMACMCVGAVDNVMGFDASSRRFHIVFIAGFADPSHRRASFDAKFRWECFL